MVETKERRVLVVTLDGGQRPPLTAGQYNCTDAGGTPALPAYVTHFA
jgi:hypothetical protein